PFVAVPLVPTVPLVGVPMPPPSVVAAEEPPKPLPPGAGVPSSLPHAVLQKANAMAPIETSTLYIEKPLFIIAARAAIDFAHRWRRTGDHPPTPFGGARCEDSSWARAHEARLG